MSSSESKSNKSQNEFLMNYMAGISTTSENNTLTNKRYSSIFHSGGLDFSTDTIKSSLDSNIFINYDYCYNCCKNKRGRKLNIEEILGGFNRDTTSDYSICLYCLCRYHPKIYLVNDTQKSIDIIETMKLLNPFVLLKEVDNLIRLHGEKYFFLSNYHINKDYKHIFWNIVFYFNVLKLPCFVLHINKNQSKNSKIVEELENSRQTHKETDLFHDFKSIFSNDSGKGSTSGKNNIHLFT